MLTHLDAVTVGGGIAYALILAFVWHLAGNPSDKVEERPAAPVESPRRSGPTPEYQRARRARLAQAGLSPAMESAA